MYSLRRFSSRASQALRRSLYASSFSRKRFSSLFRSRASSESSSPTAADDVPDDLVTAPLVVDLLGADPIGDAGGDKRELPR